MRGPLTFRRMTFYILRNRIHAEGSCELKNGVKLELHRDKLLWYRKWGIQFTVLPCFSEIHFKTDFFLRKKVLSFNVTILLTYDSLSPFFRFWTNKFPRNFIWISERRTVLRNRSLWIAAVLHSDFSMALESTQPLVKMSTRNTSWGVKAAGAWGWQPHNLHVPNVMEIWEPKPPGTLGATPGLLGETFTFYSLS
jgi:hypothetical protein